jgi:hypothetical protein
VRKRIERPVIMFSDDDFEWGEILGDSNGPAYQKTEVRSGPPLDYVAQKMRHCLEQLHGLLVWTGKYVPDDLPQPQTARGSGFSTKRDGLVSPALGAFNYGLVAYLALQNMLNLANDYDLISRLVAMSTLDFGRWLDVIEAEGSVTG